MDSSIVYPLKMFFFSGKDAILTNLRAINLNPTMTFLGIIGTLLVPILAISIYMLTHLTTHKKKLQFSIKKCLLSSFLALLLLVFLDLSLKCHKNADFKKNINKLPFGTTFLPIKQKKIITLEKSLKNAKDEKYLSKIIDEIKIPNDMKKPNIFLFVVESLRGDFITEEIAPNLLNFKNNNINFKTSLSNANATQLSWFSIFYSNFPHLWKKYADSYKNGSPVLNSFKKIGYQINVYSSAELCYFNMDKTLFGKNNNLIDNLYDISLKKIPTADKDFEIINKLNEDVLTKKDSNLFIIFLDATHSEYSWPKNFPTKFKPIDSQINYLKMILPNKNISKIKNRYKNAIHFIDHLFSNFEKKLKDEKLFNDSIILFTGDHGEEFFENGALFHGSHLNYFQTNVPIFLKLPKSEIDTNQMISHMDIFPTILHYLTDDAIYDKLSNIFDGSSLFCKKKWPNVLSVNQNCGSAPNEFILHLDHFKLWGKFLRDKNKIEIFYIESKNGPLKKIDEKKIKEAFNYLTAD